MKSVMLDAGLCGFIHDAYYDVGIINEMRTAFIAA